MYKLLLAFAVAVSLSGCVKVQLPDHMVSDTINAIKGSDDEKKSDDETASHEGKTTFSHSVVGAADAAESDLKKQCLTELESRTTELLELEEPEFTVVSESVKVSGDKAIASCTVSMS